MNNKIEQIIGEIEDYIESCKYQSFSNTKIIVNKDELEDLLSELRRKTPDEIKRYQRMINIVCILDGSQADVVGIRGGIVNDFLGLVGSQHDDFIRLGICLLHNLVLAD